MCNEHNASEEHLKDIGPRWIDTCIAPLVTALNTVGMRTVASCCGHNRRPGTVALADGREVLIAPDYETARQIDDAFPGVYPSGLGGGAA